MVLYVYFICHISTTETSAVTDSQYVSALMLIDIYIYIYSRFWCHSPPLSNLGLQANFMSLFPPWLHTSKPPSAALEVMHFDVRLKAWVKRAVRRPASVRRPSQMITVSQRVTGIARCWGLLRHYLLNHVFSSQDTRAISKWLWGNHTPCQEPLSFCLRKRPPWLSFAISLWMVKYSV